MQPGLKFIAFFADRTDAHSLSVYIKIVVH